MPCSPTKTQCGVRRCDDVVSGCHRGRLGRKLRLADSEVASGLVAVRRPLHLEAGPGGVAQGWGGNTPAARDTVPCGAPRLGRGAGHVHGAPDTLDRRTRRWGSRWVCLGASREGWVDESCHTTDRRSEGGGSRVRIRVNTSAQLAPLSVRRGRTLRSGAGLRGVSTVKFRAESEDGAICLTEAGRRSEAEARRVVGRPGDSRFFEAGEAKGRPERDFFRRVMLMGPCFAHSCARRSILSTIRTLRTSLSDGVSKHPMLQTRCSCTAARTSLLLSRCCVLLLGLKSFVSQRRSLVVALPTNAVCVGRSRPRLRHRCVGVRNTAERKSGFQQTKVPLPP